MSTGSIIGGGIRLVRTQPQTVLIWAALYFAAIIVMMVAMRPFYADMLAMQQRAAANAAAGIRGAPPIDGTFFGYLAVMEILFLLVGIVAFAAVVRATIRPGGDRFAYLRVGMDELRLLGLVVILFLCVVVVQIIVMIAMGLIVALAGALGGNIASGSMAIILALALFAVLLWIEVRISLAAPLTVMRGRIVIVEAWRATKGRFWSLFGAYLLIGLAFTAVMVVYFAVTNPGLMTAYASLDQRAMQAAGQAQLARQAAGFSAAMIVQAIVGSIVFVAMGAVLIGAMTTAAIENDRLNGSPATAA